MFISGVFLLILGAIGIFFSAFPPVDAARGGAIGVALGCGLSGLLLTYLGAPSRAEAPPEGKVKGSATILEAALEPGSVAGYQMVNLTLEVRPEGGMPYQVEHKVSSGRLGRIEAGRKIDVYYDPSNPQKLEVG